MQHILHESIITYLQRCAYRRKAKSEGEANTMIAEIESQIRKCLDAIAFGTDEYMWGVSLDI
jgi:hypothetical protein